MLIYQRVIKYKQWAERYVIYIYSYIYDQYLIYTHLNMRLVSKSLSRQPAILDPNFLEDQIKLSCCAHSKHAKLIETVYIAVFFDRIQTLAGKSSDEKYPPIFSSMKISGISRCHV